MTQTMLSQVTELAGLSVEQLKEKWRLLYAAEPCNCQKSYLVKRLAYRIQELLFTGLSESARATLRDAVRDGSDGAPDRLPRRKPRPDELAIGTRIVREWRGGRYEVTVVHGGFEYEGRMYRSLTAITKVITGSHWNGPNFFGLRKKPGKERR